MIEVAGKQFKTKTTLTNYCKFVLNNAELGLPLTGDWFDVIDGILRMHESYSEKTKGPGYSIGVRKCPINPRNRQFFILRADGTDTDFSYMKAITPKKKSSYVKETLRAAIKDQVMEWKDNYFRENADRLGYVICPETKLKVKKKNSHIDHYPKQFDEIVKEWIDMYKLNSEEIVLLSNGDNSTAWDMEDKSLLESFIRYHKEQATYRIVLDKVNLQRSKSKSYKF